MVCLRSVTNSDERRQYTASDIDRAVATILDLAVRIRSGLKPEDAIDDWSQNIAEKIVDAGERVARAPLTPPDAPATRREDLILTLLQRDLQHLFLRAESKAKAGLYEGQGLIRNAGSVRQQRAIQAQQVRVVAQRRGIARSRQAVMELLPAEDEIKRHRNQRRWREYESALTVLRRNKSGPKRAADYLVQGLTRNEDSFKSTSRTGLDKLRVLETIATGGELRRHSRDLAELGPSGAEIWNPVATAISRWKAKAPKKAPPIWRVEVRAGPRRSQQEPEQWIRASVWSSQEEP